MKKIKNDLQSKNVGTKISEGTTISQNLQNDADVDVKAAGVTLASVTGVLTTKSSDKIAKHTAAVASTLAEGLQEIAYDNAFKAGSAKVMEKYPNDTEKWGTLGYITGAEPIAAAMPGQVENVLVTLGNANTLNDVKWDVLAGVKILKVAICIGDPTVEPNWKSATPDFAFGTSTSVTVVPQITTWVRVAGVNSEGQGVWSNPAKITGL